MTAPEAQPELTREQMARIGHVRTKVLLVPQYNLKILLNGYPAHSVRCERAWAQRAVIRKPRYDPSDRVANECLHVACTCGTDSNYALYLSDQLTTAEADLTLALARAEAAEGDPTEAVIDSVRQLVLIYGNGDKSYRSVRYHLGRCGQDTSYYPDWYRTEPDTAHVTKGAFSILMYLTFQHAALAPAPAEAEQQGNEEGNK